MTDTKWRISGGLGEPEVIGQVLTQGIGFPLRPVDGVPAQDSGDIYEGLNIVQGSFMQWTGAYQAGLIYPTGSVTLDSGWLMVANQNTASAPAPVPVGTPAWALGTPAFATQSNLSTVYSGHTYTFLQTGIVSGIRVWVPELSGTTNYRIVVSDVTNPSYPKVTIIDDPLLTEDAWKTVALNQRLVSAGDKFIIYIDALNSGDATPITGGWAAGVNSQANGPARGSWNRDNQNVICRIDKFDLDGTDRTTELLSMTAGASIQFVETTEADRSISFNVRAAPLDLGTYVEYLVVLDNLGPLGAPLAQEITTMNASVPTPLATQYSEVAGVTSPAWATVAGFLEFDGADQVGDANTYGVDIEFDEAIINTEWDIMSFDGV